MNPSLSPIDVNEASASLEEQLQPVRGTDIQAILPAHFRNRDPKWLLVDEGFTLPPRARSRVAICDANGSYRRTTSYRETHPILRALLSAELLHVHTVSTRGYSKL